MRWSPFGGQIGGYNPLRAAFFESTVVSRRVGEAEILQNLADRPFVVDDPEALSDELLQVDAPPTHHVECTPFRRPVTRDPNRITQSIGPPCHLESRRKAEGNPYRVSHHGRWYNLRQPASGKTGAVHSDWTLRVAAT